MKSIIFTALAAATLATAAPAKQAAAGNSSSIADPVAQAALENALGAQGGNVNNAAGAQAQAAQAQAAQAAQLAQLGQVSSVSSSSAVLTQILLDQAQSLCAAQVLAVEAATQTVLIQGLAQAAVQTVVPFLGGAQSAILNANVINNGFANSGLLDLNSLAAISGAVIDPVLGLQVVEVVQEGLGTIGIAPIIQGLAVSSGFPIIQNNQLIQVVSLDQAIAQNLAFNQALAPILVNGVLQQIFPIDSSILLAAGGLLNGLPLVSGVNVAAIPFNLASNSVWNFGLQQANLGVLNSGVANVLALSIGTPFNIQASSFFNSGSAVLGVPPSNAVLAAPAQQTVFLLADNSVSSVNFADLGSLAISNTIQLAAPSSSLRKF